MSDWTQDDFIQAVSQAGEAHGNDYDDDKDGWFGFTVSRLNNTHPKNFAVLTASWQSALEEGDADLVQEQHFYLVPFDPEAKAVPEGKHEREA